ncbi:MAG: hypothetical protein VB062_04215 [Christensenella sp.]|nr:hypothetical protein [Christensenella sp.]
MSIQELRHYGLFARTRKHKPWWLMRRVLFALSAMLFLCPVILRSGGAMSRRPPEFTYTGTYALLDDGDGNWRIRFFTSGMLTMTKRAATIDIFCVGGGGSGGRGANTNYGSGGGGGYTTLLNGLVLASGVGYTVFIGAGGTNLTASGAGNRGGTSSLALEGSVLTQAEGGYGGIYNGTPTYPYGAGGSGGSTLSTDGGSNGSTPSVGGQGQGTTTREFHEGTGALYSGGGAGCAYNTTRRFGGAGGGGNGGVTSTSTPPTAGTPNTGGGGGAYGAGLMSGSTAGGSGIVVIRNHRAAA